MLTSARPECSPAPDLETHPTSDSFCPPNQLPASQSISDTSARDCVAKSAPQSCLYVGKIQHARLRPVEHSFQYGLFMAYIDLAEIEGLFNNWFCSTSPWSPVQLRRADYFGNANRPLAECVRERVQLELDIPADGPVRMLTNLRYFGFVFNPVTFYFCYDTRGQELLAVLADVTNTPWGERHAYVIPIGKDSDVSEHQCEKAFHVSPFMAMDQEYRWRIAPPQDHLRITIENHDLQGRLFVANLNLSQRPFSKWRLAGLLAAFPWVTAKIFVAIYWQALRLWWKRVPFVPHPKSATQPNNQ